MPGFLLIILAILVLSILILVHEFGHYIAARMSKVWVEEFGIGLPPRAWGKKIGDTLYSINWLPLGGFVRLHGESPDMKITKPEMAFINKPKLVRAFIAVNGIVMNFFFALLAFTAMFVLTGIPRGISVVDVVEGSPADVAGVQAQDVVTGYNNTTFVGVDEFLMTIREYRGQTLSLNIERNGEAIAIPVDVRDKAPEGEGLTGIGYDVQPKEIIRPDFPGGFFVYPYYGGRETVKWTVLTVDALASLFSDVSSGKVPQGLTGPLGVTLTIAEVIRYGIVAVLSFMGIISVNLALINIVPIPPLDGSRIVLLGVEKVIGKKRLQKYEGHVLTAGFVFMIGLILLITASEIPKIISAGSITGFVDSLFVE